MITINDIFSRTANPKTYFKGYDNYKNKKVTTFSCKRVFSNPEVLDVKATFGASSGDTYSPSITVRNGQIHDWHCDCPDFGEKTNKFFCEHLVAAALTYQEREAEDTLFSNEQPTSLQVIDLIQTYTDKILHTNSANPVRLVPTLNIENPKSPFLSFKIGKDFMYTLKSIEQFIADLQFNYETVYGKNFTFKSSLYAFDPFSRQLAEFIMKHSTNANRYDMRSSNEIAKSVLLQANNLDEFFDIYAGKDISVSAPFRVSAPTLEVVRENPHITLKLNEISSNSYEFELKHDEFIALSTPKKLYYINKEKIYICDDSFSQVVAPMLSVISTKKLIVSSKHLPDLTSNVLSELKDHITIESNIDPWAYLPEAFIGEVFLDMPEHNRVTAKIECKYPTRTFNLQEDFSINHSRNIRQETILRQVVDKYFKKEEGLVYTINDESKIYSFVSSGIEELRQLANIYSTDSFSNAKIKPPISPSIGVRLQSDLLEISIDLGDIPRDEISALLSSYKQKKSFHRLKDGSFLSLENSCFSELVALQEGLGLSKREFSKDTLTLPKFRALYLDEVISQSNGIKFDVDEAFSRVVNDFNRGQKNYPIPSDLEGTLRKYQKAGYQWLRALADYGFGGILADDMGLGKTLQVISIFKSLPPNATSLVVCPSSLIYNWESEINKFAPDLKARVIAGSQPERQTLLSNLEDVNVVITSYDLLKRDIESYLERSFDFQVIDEAQYIKNHTTQNAQAVKLINAKHRLALTGTPVENTLAELWSIFDYLMPGYLFSYSRFKNHFEVPIVRFKEDYAIDRLTKMTRPFILRRLKKDVLKELPDKTEIVVKIKLEEEQEKLYQANLLSMKQTLDTSFNPGQDKLMVLSMLTRLRQICCDPHLIYENYENKSGKLESCMELLFSCIASGHKVLLFSQFTSMLELIEKELISYNIAYYKLTGATKSDQRLSLANAFNEDSTPVFLISLKAGGTGLNLTGADVVIHYDPWWNSSAQNQATDRAHRINQKNPVTVYKLISKDTIEEKILKMQQEKSALADMIIKDGNTSIASMSKEDILDLFSL